MSVPSELHELRARRPRGLRPLFMRYVMGRATERLYTKDELRAKVGWKDDDTDANNRRLRIIEAELRFTMDGLREQFAKGRTVLVVCIAAIIAIWVQSPRLKIFRFRDREQTLQAAEVLVFQTTMIAMVALAYVGIVV